MKNLKQIRRLPLYEGHLNFYNFILTKLKKLNGRKHRQ